MGTLIRFVTFSLFFSLLLGCGAQSGLEDERETSNQISNNSAETDSSDLNKQTSVTEFDAVGYYQSDCAACHGANGKGFGNFPSLVSSSYELASLTTEIAQTMPLGNIHACVDDCAEAVALFILQEFNGQAGDGGDQGNDDSDTDEKPEEPQLVPPLPATQVSVVSMFDNQQVEVTWQDQSDNEDGFYIFRSVDMAAFSFRQFVPANNKRYFDGSVAEGHSYRYQIVAFNNAGESAHAESNSVHLIAAQKVPGTPSSIQLNQLDSHVQVTWQDNSDNESHFVIERRVDMQPWTWVANHFSNQWTDTAVEFDRVYQYRIKAVNSAGDSGIATSQALTVTFAEDSADFYAAQCGSCHGDNGEGVATFPPVNNPDYQLAELTAVIANTMPLNQSERCGSSCAQSMAEYILAEFAHEVLPGMATNVVAVPSSAHDFIGVSWVDQSDNESGFKILRKVNMQSWQQVFVTDENIAQFNDMDVSDGNDYRYQIIAFNGVGENTPAASNLVELREIVTLPEKPSQLSSIVSSYTVVLDWVDQADNEDSYIVERMSLSGQWLVLSNSVIGEQFTDHAVEIGSSYSYRVKAQNSAGSSAYSNVTEIEVPYELTYQKAFEEKCSGCHNPQGVGGDLFDGFKVSQWEDKYYREFMDKVATMQTQSCGDTCQDNAATYVWVTQWRLDKFAEPVVDDSRGVRNVRLLTPYEYKNTIKTLFGIDVDPESLANVIVDDEFKFPTNASHNTVLYDDVLTFKSLAEGIVDQINLQQVGCSAQTCSNQQLSELGSRIFRRPLTSNELAEYTALRDSEGLRDSIASMLLSPYFLYRFEIGEWNAQKNAYQLTDYEIASALAYELWGTTPDQTLLDLAAVNQLSQPAQITAKATEMIADSKFADHFLEFIRYYTKTYEETHEKPGLTQVVIDAMVEEQKLAITDWLNDSDQAATLTRLFSPGYTFVNAALAAHYNLSLPNPSAGAQFQQVNDSLRGGLLHHGIVQILNSDFAATSLVKRGKMIRENMLCHSMGVPSGIDPDTIDLPSHAITTRERWHVITGPDASEGQCWQCHQLMNEPGSALENYDQTGQYRLQETAYNNTNVQLTVDASGILRSNSGAEVLTNYGNARELADYLGESSEVHDCFVDNYYRYSRGFDIDGQVADEISVIQTNFKNDGDVKVMIKALYSSELFLYRLDR